LVCFVQRPAASACVVQHAPPTRWSVLCHL